MNVTSVTNSLNNDPRPPVSSILKIINHGGVIVGSYPISKYPKDLDIVIRPRKLEEQRNPIFDRITLRWKKFTKSSAPGHLFISCKEIPVEIFEDDLWDLNDPIKRKNQITFNQARRNSTIKKIFGIDFYVLNHRE